MIEKMKYVNLAGPVDGIDRIIETYISQYEIQLEYAVRELDSSEGTEAFIDPNPYLSLYNDARNLSDISGSYTGKIGRIERDEAERIICEANGFIRSQKSETSKLDERVRELTENIENLKHFYNLDFNLEDLRKFKSIACVFGKMPVNSFLQFKNYLNSDDAQVIFLSGETDSEDAWGVYFTPSAAMEKVSVMFNTMHFKPIKIFDEIDGENVSGRPSGIVSQLQEKLKGLIHKRAEILSFMDITAERVAAACDFVKKMFFYYDCRKYACKTAYRYFLFVGWMAQADAEKLSEAIEDDGGVMMVIADSTDYSLSKPPTKLKNNMLFKPFEFLIRMYGVPSYDEIDPTPLVALSYSLFFGMMFGDAGQGAVLSLLGVFLHKVKKSALGSILIIVGIFSVFFGFMYGSFFGFEHILPTYWIKPADNIMSMVVFAILTGAVTVVVCMSYNIANAVRKKNTGELLFGPNGISGLLFYVFAVAFALAIMFGGASLPVPLIAVCAAVPLILVALKEPLSETVTKKKHRRGKKQSAGLTAFITVMELIEVILSFFTNTLSFVRVAGYAICHAGLMQVVMLLSGAEEGRTNIIVVILGNLFVMALEGLIVFIQVMRLQYYEMFSRYYEGGGREFVAYKNVKY